MTDPLDQPENDDLELVVPFIACRSEGGPYDDAAFVAGFQAGQVDQALAGAKAAGATEVTSMMGAELVKQVELIAMNRGFPVMDVEVADENPGYAAVTFRTEARES